MGNLNDNINKLQKDIEELQAMPADVSVKLEVEEKKEQLEKILKKESESKIEQWIHNEFCLRSSVEPFYGWFCDNMKLLEKIFAIKSELGWPLLKEVRKYLFILLYCKSSPENILEYIHNNLDFPRSLLRV